jgi:hypothetical protein
MICAVHALIGATVARLCRTRAQALLAGAASHLVSDMLPHRDLGIPKEAALLGGALALVVGARGADSREFAGALGAALPDLENLIGRVLGIPDGRLLFPTHRWWHGRSIRSVRAQVSLAAVGAACLLAPEVARESGDVVSPRDAGEERAMGGAAGRAAGDGAGVPGQPRG